mgnify:CR=1 FL=1
MHGLVGEVAAHPALHGGPGHLEPGSHFADRPALVDDELGDFESMARGEGLMWIWMLGVALVGMIVVVLWGAWYLWRRFTRMTESLEQLTARLGEVGEVAEQIDLEGLQQSMDGSASS